MWIKLPFIITLYLLLSTNGYASIEDLFGEFNSELEEQAALASLTTYNQLIERSGCSENLREESEPESESESCSGQTFLTFQNVREIIHTANELTGNGGPTQFSLGLDLEGLGFALRWTAAEEYAAQGSISREFASSQLSGLAARLSALRMGARGFQVGGFFGDTPWFTGAENTISDAEAYSPNSDYSPWGGFINGSFGYGSKAPSEFEDAFDFEGRQINIGVDYRIDKSWVLGTLLDFTEQEVDFDSSLSIVDGAVESKAINFMPFLLYQHDAIFTSASTGFQRVSFDSRRDITYPSLNPNTSSTDTTTVSSTDANIWSLFGEIGYNWQHKKAAVEPYVNLEFMRISIDGFEENDLNNDAFNLAVEKQSFKSQLYTLGVKIQYVITPQLGVFIPYFTAESLYQTEVRARTIQARYANAATTDPSFFVSTNGLDDHYNVFTLGVSGVLRGARQTRDGGHLAGGIQGFFEYTTVKNLDHYKQESIAFGLRYEF